MIWTAEEHFEMAEAANLPVPGKLVLKGTDRLYALPNIIINIKCIGIPYYQHLSRETYGALLRLNIDTTV